MGELAPIGDTSPDTRSGAPELYEVALLVVGGGVKSGVRLSIDPGLMEMVSEPVRREILMDSIDRLTALMLAETEKA